MDLPEAGPIHPPGYRTLVLLHMLLKVHLHRIQNRGQYQVGDSSENANNRFYKGDGY